MKHTEKKQTYKTNTANSCDKKGKKNGLNVLIQNEGKTGSEENQVQKFTSQQKTHKHKQGKTYKMRKFHPTKQKQKSFFFLQPMYLSGDWKMLVRTGGIVQQGTSNMKYKKITKNAKKASCCCCCKLLREPPKSSQKII